MESTTTILLAIFFAWVFLPLLTNKICYSTWYISLVTVLVSLFFTSSPSSIILKVFVVLFCFRNIRLIGNLVAFILYKPVPLSDHPIFKAEDVTVIVPTVEPHGDHFDECIRSIYANGPARIFIVTAGPGLYDIARRSTAMYPNVTVKNCNVQNKRRQICAVLPMVW